MGRQRAKVENHWYILSNLKYKPEVTCCSSSVIGLVLVWKKIARLEKVKDLCNIFQNDLAFQGIIVKAILSEFPVFYYLIDFKLK